MSISSIGSNYYYTTSQTQNYYRYKTSGQNSAASTATSTASSTAASSSGTQIDPMALFEMFQSLSGLRRSEINGDIEESKETMDAVRSQVDTIKSLDLESLSDDEVSEILSSFQQTLSSVSKVPTAAQTLKDSDLSTMSATDKSALLESIQTEAINMESTQGKGGHMRPNGPPPGGAPPSSVTESTSATASTSDTEKTAMEKLLEELLAKLEENQFNSTDSESDTTTEQTYTKSQLIDFLKQFAASLQLGTAETEATTDSEDSTDESTDTTVTTIQ